MSASSDNQHMLGLEIHCATVRYPKMEERLSASSDNRHMLGNAILDKLEPEALSANTGNAADALIASLAISMKRIADLLEEIELKPGLDYETKEDVT